MNKNAIGYWIVTGLFCLALGLGGVANLARLEPQRVIIEDLGYPVYLMSILGVAKILGVAALLMPGWPRLKEWAYAGFTFDLLGASASHAFSGEGIPSIVMPLIMLMIGAASYTLRPPSRRIVSSTQSPAAEPRSQAPQNGNR